MRNQRRIITLIILGIIAFLIIGGGVGYYMIRLAKEIRQRAQEQAKLQYQPPVNQPNETTDWKVYTDQNQQWQIKLSKNYTESKDNNTIIFTSKVLSNNLNVSDLNYDVTYFIALYITEDTLPMNISLTNYVDTLTKPKYNEGLCTMSAELLRSS